MTIKTFRYNEISQKDQALLNDLLLDVWHCITSSTYPEEMNAMCFCAVEEEKFIGQAGVITWNIKVKGKSFKMCALNCVSIHSQHRKKGIGRLLVKRATEWIMQSDCFDIGLFTCSVENAAFYERVGKWEGAPDLVIKSDKKGRYASDEFGLKVFKLLISEKAKLYADAFKHNTIVLNFPRGYFI